MDQIPKLSLPLRLGSEGRFATVEQDSGSEVAACVYAVLATPLGSRLEVPGYGIVDPTFDTLPLNLSESLAAISDWEPRANVQTTEEIEAATERVSYGVQSNDLGGIAPVTPSAESKLPEEEIPIPDLGELVGSVIHGSSKTRVRPAGFPCVVWIGTVTPENMIEDDLYINLTEATISIGT